MRYYPVYLDLRDRPCVIVGGGRVAERKALSLLEAGADVTIVSPTLTPKLETLFLSGNITHKSKVFDDHDITGSHLVIAATDSQELNSGIGNLCRKKNILVNVATSPEESTFIVPSVVDRGGLLIAISTGGASPALAKKLRRELEAAFGPEYEVFIEKMTVMRNVLLKEVPDEGTRRVLFQRLVDSNVLELLKQGKVQEADHLIREISGMNG
jgi:precorrin-2 dehydrogenase/sirohydrochlorin ferrochelatase